MSLSNHFQAVFAEFIFDKYPRSRLFNEIAGQARDDTFVAGMKK